MADIIKIPAFTPPGARFGRNFAPQMLAFGQTIRDELIWQFPLLPGGVFIYTQMASEREWKVSGKPRSVARAIEYFNDAQTLNYDGTVDYGLEQMERRRALDNICVGRTMFTWGDKGEPLRYLDPTQMTYYLDRRQWVDNWTQEAFPVERVVVNHPIPVGNAGSFISPISFLIPTAQLAWLVREHDRASADGRKIRDLMIVAGKQLADSMEEGVKAVLKLWDGADVTELGIPMVEVEIAPGMKVSDLVHRIGLANIPPDFNREQFQFQYANDTANTLGLALRYIWNSEKATNRALEEVQEARQALKGPAGFVRTEQRLFTRSRMLEQFGDEAPRFGFIEQVDMASMEINAKVLKLYAEAFQIFITNLGGTVNADALVAWLQRDDILPADLDIITDFVQVNSEEPPTPVGDNIQRDSDGPTPINKAVEDVIEDGEITMNGNGEIIERRNKVFTIEKAILAEIEADATTQIEQTKAFTEKKTLSFDAAVKSARAKNIKRFSEIMGSEKALDDDIAKEVFERIENLEEDDHRKIKALLDSGSA